MGKNGESSDFNATRAELFEAISHPVRINILQALSEKPMGFSELGRAVGIESGGHLGFHLAKLAHLVKTTPEGTYALTDDGREALWSIGSLRRSANWNHSVTHERTGPRWESVLLISFLIAIILLSGVVLQQQQTNSTQQGMITSLRSQNSVQSKAIANLTSQVSQLSRSIARLAPAWYPYQDYPTTVTGESCTGSPDAIYCVGGQVGTRGLPTNLTYYLPTSPAYYGSFNWSAGWVRTTDYPRSIAFTSCVTSSGYIYCMDGFLPPGNGTLSGEAYFAPISPSGVGQWQRTEGPPFEGRVSCAASTDYVYCLGSASAIPQQSFYASLSSSGISVWRLTLTYPIIADLPPCVISAGYIYCVGGSAYREVAGQNQLEPINATYFAPVSSSGIGLWARTTDYPTDIETHSCVASSGFIYCVGGFTLTQYETSATYYAPLSPSGIGPWSQASDYPVGMWLSTCATSSVSIICVGGVEVESRTDSVFFALLSDLNSHGNP